jgi:patatin-related protein
VPQNDDDVNGAEPVQPPPVPDPAPEAGGNEPPPAPAHTAGGFERQEIRLALVMTGGVSLAVWIGGAVAEFDRIARRAGLYGPLLDLLEATVMVDVIGGTSAGGVNGGLLALGLIRGADLSMLRATWLDLGSIKTMLRLPTEEHPPSLLRGDDYFLDVLREAYESLAAAGPASDPTTNPMHLLMTTTLLRGERRVFQDDYGGRIHDLSHRGTFSFVRGEDWGRDDFADPGVANSLALASRATASFPGAFEPTFTPIGQLGADQHRPDMSPFADFAHGGFVMDGGVLSNKPIREVLEVLFTRQTEGQGRRVLAYVIPDPNLPAVRDETGEDGDAVVTAIPPMVRAIGSSMQIPRVESVAPDLEAIRTHNRQVAGQRRLRESLLRAGGLDPGDLANQVFPAYVGTRRDYRARWILGLLGRGMHLPSESGGIRSWDRSAVSGALSRALERLLPQAFPATPEDVPGWIWDIAGVKGAIGVASHLLRIALDRAPDETSAVDRETLLGGRRSLDEVRRALQRFRRDEETYWTGDRVRRLREALESAKSDRDERLAEWAAASFAASPSVQRAGELGDMANRVAAIVAAAGPPDSTLRTLRWILAVVVVQTAFSGSEPEVEQVIELLQVSAETPNAFDARRTGAEKLAGIQLGHFGAFYKRSWRANDWMWGRLDAVRSLLRVAIEPARLRRLATRDPGFADRFEEGLRRLALGDPNDASLRPLREPWDEGRFALELAFLRDPSLPVPRSLEWCIAALQRRMQLEILREELPRVASAAGQDIREGAADRPEARAFIQLVHDAQHAAPEEQTEGSADTKNSTAKAPRERGRHAVPDDQRRRSRRRRRRGPLPDVDPTVPLSPQAALRAFDACVVGKELIQDEAGTRLYRETTNGVAAVGLRAARRHVEETNEALGREPPPKVTLRVILPVIRSILASSSTVFWVMTVLLVAGAALLGWGLWQDQARWPSTITGGVLALLGVVVALFRMNRGRIVAALGVLAVAAALLGASYSMPDEPIGSGSFRAAVIGVAGLALIVLGRPRRHKAPVIPSRQTGPPPPAAQPKSVAPSRPTDGNLVWTPKP